MVKKLILNIVNAIVDMIWLLLGLGFSAFSISTFLGYNTAPPLSPAAEIMSLFVGLFFGTGALCSIICGRHFTKALQGQHQTKPGLINILPMPDTWYKKLYVFNAAGFCGTLFLKSIGVKKLKAYQKDYLQHPNFLAAARPIDYILSWLLALTTAGVIVMILVMAV